MIDWNYDLTAAPRDNTKILVSYRVRLNNSLSIAVVRFYGDLWITSENFASGMRMSISAERIYAWAPLLTPAEPK